MLKVKRKTFILNRGIEKTGKVKPITTATTTYQKQKDEYIPEMRQKSLLVNVSAEENKNRRKPLNEQNNITTQNDIKIIRVVEMENKDVKSSSMPTKRTSFELHDNVFLDDDDDNGSDNDNELKNYENEPKRLYEKEKLPSSQKYQSDSENDSILRKSDGRGISSSPETNISHRKSVSFDLSSDEKCKSDFETRSHSPDPILRNRRAYDSEQEYEPRKSRNRYGLKGILRSTSPSSSVNSTLEKQQKSPTVPVITKIKEIPTLSTVQRTPSPSTSYPLEYNEEFTSTSHTVHQPLRKLEKLTSDDEIERENPFREAFQSPKKDVYEEMAKIYSQAEGKRQHETGAILKKPNRDHFVVGCKEKSNSNENLDQFEQHARLQKITPADVSVSLSDKKPPIKPLPPPKPKIKQAEVIKNAALETLQSELLRGDIIEYEHNAETNTIREIPKDNKVIKGQQDSLIHKMFDISSTTNNIRTQRDSFSPDTPLPPVPVSPRDIKSTLRPKESPPPPPINFDTLPSLDILHTSKIDNESDILEIIPSVKFDVLPSPKCPELICENSPNNILVSEDVHRKILLQENELRNAVLKEQHDHHQQQQPNKMTSRTDDTIISPVQKNSSPPQSARTPKTVSDKKRFFETAMEEQQKPTQKQEKVFSFLSKDEVENLKQEEEKKIATLQRDKKLKIIDDNSGSTGNSRNRRLLIDDITDGGERRNDKIDESGDGGGGDIMDDFEQREIEEYERYEHEYGDSEDTSMSSSASVSQQQSQSQSQSSSPEHIIKKKPSLLPKPKIKLQPPKKLITTTVINEPLQSRIPIRSEKRNNLKDMSTSTLSESTNLSEPTTSSFIQTDQDSCSNISYGDCENYDDGVFDDNANNNNQIKRDLRSPENVKTSNNIEKRAAWRAARLKSLEQDTIESKKFIKNMTQFADDLLEETKNEKIVFPKIAIKSSSGPVVIREREKILDEKIIRRTEEIQCPITGQSQFRTVEYIEKLIETEVETSQEKIISLELQDPENDSEDTLLLPTPPKHTPHQSTSSSLEYDPNSYENDEEDAAETATASIVTIRTNPDKLFLRHSTQDSSSHGSFGRPITKIDDNDDDTNYLQHQSSFEVFDAPGNTNNQKFMKNQKIISSPTTTTTMQTIVEVVNPIISGDGSANKIVIGRSTDSRQIFDNDDDEDDDDETDDFNRTYPVNQETTSTTTKTITTDLPQYDDDYDDDEKPELSLNAKMKNVLEELLENERVKLNLSRSIIETDDDEGSVDEKDYFDEEEEAEEKEKNQNKKYVNMDTVDNVSNGNKNTNLTSIDNKSNIQFDPNQNRTTNVEYNDEYDKTFISKADATIGDDDEFDEDDDDDYENALDDNSFVDGCRVYKNPNAEVSFEQQEITKQQQPMKIKSLSAHHQQSQQQISDENRALREKLMSQLHVGGNVASNNNTKQQQQQKQNKIKDFLQNEREMEEKSKQFIQKKQDSVQPDEIKSEKNLIKKSSQLKTKKLSKIPQLNDDNLVVTKVIEYKNYPQHYSNTPDELLHENIQIENTNICGEDDGAASGAHELSGEEIFLAKLSAGSGVGHKKPKETLAFQSFEVIKTTENLNGSTKTNISSGLVKTTVGKKENDYDDIDDNIIEDDDTAVETTTTTTTNNNNNNNNGGNKKKKRKGKNKKK